MENAKRRMHKHSSFKLSITNSFPKRKQAPDLRALWLTIFWQRGASFPTCDVYGNQPCCKRQKAFKVIRLSYSDTEQSKLQGIHCVDCQIFHFFIPVNQLLPLCRCSGGGIRVRESRIYATKEEAEKAVGKNTAKKETGRYLDISSE